MPVSRKNGSSSIISVVAGPPHPIKVAPLHRALQTVGLGHQLIDLGYYSVTSGKDLYESLALPPPVIGLALEISKRNSAATRIDEESALIAKALYPLRPSAVIVYGDLPGSVAAATAARCLNIPVVHVEAGRRSFDTSDDEEYNRVALSSVASLHLAPSPAARNNLIFEGINSNNVIVVGNLAVATLLAITRELGPCTANSQKRVIVAFHRSELEARQDRLKAIAGTINKLPGEVEVTILDYGFIPLVPLIRRRKRITVLSRLPLQEYVATLRSASAVLTDSTGFQDDAAALGIPCVTMRTATHCVESVEFGTNEIVGYDDGEAQRCLRHALATNSDFPHLSSWGEGAGEKAAAAIHNFLSVRIEQE